MSLLCVSPQDHSDHSSSNCHSGFQRVKLEGDPYQTLEVAVPSRLRSRKSSNRPLAGTRIAVKDMFDMQGLRTSVGSRGYFNLYQESKTAAASIQSLIDEGAEVLGKTKPSLFTAREEPTKCVEYQAPLNPRGDGCQSPARSSSGSAAATASYEWLDFAIGSDSKLL